MSHHQEDQKLKCLQAQRPRVQVDFWKPCAWKIYKYERKIWGQIRGQPQVFTLTFNSNCKKSLFQSGSAGVDSWEIKNQDQDIRRLLTAFSFILDLQLSFADNLHRTFTVNLPLLRPLVPPVNTPHSSTAALLEFLPPFNQLVLTAGR